MKSYLLKLKEIEKEVFPKTIGLCNGSFDLLHVDHVHHLN